MLLNISDINELFKANKSQLIVMYAHSRMRVATHLPLAKEIIASGYDCVILHNRNFEILSEDVNDYEEVPIGPIFQENISKLDRISIFITDEIHCHLAPARSIRIAIHHSLPDGSFEFKYADVFKNKWSMIKDVDYYAIAVYQKPDWWKVKLYKDRTSDIYPKAMLSERTEFINVIPLGYPKIEYLERELNCSHSSVIMYCPTSLTFSKSNEISTSIEVINALLEALPNYKIVFRPYPGSKGLESLYNEFKSNYRFQIDLSVTGISHMRNAALMVTDQSSVAVTFSLGSGRPSIFFQNIPEFEYRVDCFEPIGVRVYCISQLISQARKFIDNLSYWRSNILENRGKYVYNPGSASRFLVKNIPLILKRKPVSGGLKVPRQGYKNVQTVVEAIHHLDLLSSNIHRRNRVKPNTINDYMLIVNYYESKFGFKYKEESNNDNK